MASPLPSPSPTETRDAAADKLLEAAREASKRLATANRVNGGILGVSGGQGGDDQKTRDWKQKGRARVQCLRMALSIDEVRGAQTDADSCCNFSSEGVCCDLQVKKCLDDAEHNREYVKAKVG